MQVHFWEGVYNYTKFYTEKLNQLRILNFTIRAGGVGGANQTFFFFFLLSAGQHPVQKASNQRHGHWPASIYGHLRESDDLGVSVISDLLTKG